uniref:Uncharacterized protein n=1 Tax=Arundo donax TaxID=35708 RepID=A0A0A9FU44_ARUDO
MICFLLSPDCCKVQILAADSSTIIAYGIWLNILVRNNLVMLAYCTCFQKLLFVLGNE